MKQSLLVALFIATTSLLPAANAQVLSSQQKIDDFNQLSQSVRANYGPFDYKTANGIVDINKHIEKYRLQIEASKTNADFYKSILEFVGGFQDGHFSVASAATQNANIPLLTEIVQSKVLITKIDRSKLPEDKFSFQVGDEILSVDGKPVLDVVKDLSLGITSGNPKTVQKIASWLIFHRSSSRMSIPTAKTVKVEIRRGLTNLTDEVTLEWAFAGAAGDESATESIITNVRKNFFNARFTERNASFGYISNIHGMELAHSAGVDFMCNATTRVAVPKDAKWIMQAPFTVYTYPTPKGQVGYLRIPHYMPQPKPGQTSSDAFEEFFETYRYAVKKLEASTVGLIIDQDHNCGGAVFLVENIAALFMNKPIRPMPFSLKATKATALQYKNYVKEAPVSLSTEYYKKVAEVLESTWKKSPGGMTDIVYLTGRDIVPVDPVANYTKPIVILIDEVAGSGGDAFPSVMKGEGRAKLFGQQTSGLGGSIARLPALNNSQMNVSMTASLFFKPDGTAVENNGAIPDQTYEITRDDILFGYRPYQKAYTDYLLEQIP